MIHYRDQLPQGLLDRNAELHRIIGHPLDPYDDSRGPEPYRVTLPHAGPGTTPGHASGASSQTGSRTKRARSLAVSRLMSGQQIAKISTPWVVPMTCLQRALTPFWISSR